MDLCASTRTIYDIMDTVAPRSNLFCLCISILGANWQFWFFVELYHVYILASAALNLKSFILKYNVNDCY